MEPVLIAVILRNDHALRYRLSEKYGIADIMQLAEKLKSEGVTCESDLYQKGRDA